MLNFSQTYGPHNEMFQIFSKPKKWVLICRILSHFTSKSKKVGLYYDFFKKINFKFTT